MLDALDLNNKFITIGLEIHGLPSQKLGLNKIGAVQCMYAMLFRIEWESGKHGFPSHSRPCTLGKRAELMGDSYILWLRRLRGPFHSTL